MTNWGIFPGWCSLVAREILARDVRRGHKMVAFLVCCVALAISAMYELIEGGQRWQWAADDFLGTQGDPWIRNPICSAHYWAH